MAFFRTLGKGVGVVAGSLIGGGIKLTGKLIKSEWIESAGNGIDKGSKLAFDALGQLIDSTLKGSYEVISKNEKVKLDGKDDLKGTTVHALEELEETVPFKSVGIAFGGQKGANEKGKAGFVAVMAVGGINPLKESESRSVEGRRSTKEELPSQIRVPFVEKTIELPIGEVTGTFPVFDVGFEVKLPESLYLQSDLVHFSYANVELSHAIKSNSDLIHELGLASDDIEELLKGNTPNGYAWHHHEEAGRLQLVDEDYHQHNGHTGGRELWGGGFENR
jgi:DNase/tRNase domain of colicin-like bacteriocin